MLRRNLTGLDDRIVSMKFGSLLDLEPCRQGISQPALCAVIPRARARQTQRGFLITHFFGRKI